MMIATSCCGCRSCQVISKNIPPLYLDATVQISHARGLRPRGTRARGRVSAPRPGGPTGQANGVSASGDISLADAWLFVLGEEWASLPNTALSATEKKG